MAGTIEEKIAELERLTSELKKQSKEAEARLAEEAKKADDSRKNERFWNDWLEAKGTGLFNKVIGVIVKYNNFVIWDEETRATFFMELIERCYNAYGNFDPNKSVFSTWVCWNARSLADSIIKSSILKNTGQVGRGMSWPFLTNERLLTEMIPGKMVLGDTLSQVDITEEELEILGVEDDTSKEEVQIWICEECQNAKVRVVIESVWQHCEQRNEHNLPYQTPSDLALARITKLTSTEIRQILDELGNRFVERFGVDGITTI